MEQKIDLILAAQDIQENDMKELKKDIKQLKTDVGLLPKIQLQLTTVKTDITELKTDVNDNKASIADLEARIKEISEVNEELQRNFQQQSKLTLGDISDNKKNKVAEQVTEQVTEQIRRIGKRKQLIFEGIAENQSTPLETLIGQIIHDTGVKTTPQDIDQVFRVGIKSKTKPRAVLVTFTKQSTRDKIYRARQTIKTNPACQYIWINEALDDTQRYERSLLRALSELAREEGLETKAVGDVLIVQGIKYNFATIDKLPHNITLERAYLRETEDSLYFQSEFSWPSSFAPVNIKYLGTPYTTLEQGYTHRMAVKSGDAEVANEILREHRPRRCKALAKRIKNLNWTEEDEQTEMAALVHKKFQLPEYRRKLVATEGKRLVECTKDRKWAGGVTLWSQEVKSNSKVLPGKNLLGKILEQERKKILDNLTQGLDTDQESENPDEDTPPALEGDDVEQPTGEQEQQDV